MPAPLTYIGSKKTRKEDASKKGSQTGKVGNQSSSERGEIGYPNGFGKKERGQILLVEITGLQY